MEELNWMRLGAAMLEGELTTRRNEPRAPGCGHSVCERIFAEAQADGYIGDSIPCPVHGEQQRIKPCHSPRPVLKTPEECSTASALVSCIGRN